MVIAILIFNSRAKQHYRSWLGLPLVLGNNGQAGLLMDCLGNNITTIYKEYLIFMKRFVGQLKCQNGKIIKT